MKKITIMRELAIIYLHSNRKVVPELKSSNRINCGQFIVSFVII